MTETRTTLQIGALVRRKINPKGLVRHVDDKMYHVQFFEKNTCKEYPPNPHIIPIEDLDVLMENSKSGVGNIVRHKDNPVGIITAVQDGQFRVKFPSWTRTLLMDEDDIELFDTIDGVVVENDEKAPTTIQVGMFVRDVAPPQRGLATTNITDSYCSVLFPDDPREEIEVNIKDVDVVWKPESSMCGAVVTLTQGWVGIVMEVTDPTEEDELDIKVLFAYSNYFVWYKSKREHLEILNV